MIGLVRLSVMHKNDGGTMNEQDCRAVENMCLTGMELDGLYACFPKFPREEIERIYMATKIKTDEDPADTLISVNCS